jgi:hypothetical protein
MRWTDAVALAVVVALFAIPAVAKYLLGASL